MYIYTGSAPDSAAIVAGSSFGWSGCSGPDSKAVVAFNRF